MVSLITMNFKFFIFIFYPIKIFALYDDLTQNTEIFKTKREVKTQVFANYTLRNCSEKNDILFIENLTIEPTPVKLEEKIKLKLTLKLLRDIPSPIEMRIDAEAVISNLFNNPQKMKFPCELLARPLNLECPLKDICETVFIKGKNCTNMETNEIYSCACPLKKGIIAFQELTVDLGMLPEPVSRLLRVFHPQASVKVIAKQRNERIGCISADAIIFAT